MKIDFKKIAGLIGGGTVDGLAGLANTALSIVKDKTRDADESFINEKIKKGVSISSKRVLNLTGTGAILAVALGDIAANGLSWQSIGLVGLGAAYSFGMAYLSKNS